MPYSVRKSPQRGYDIINKETGAKVGHSESKEKAEASVRARYAGENKPKVKKR
jgi:hypothetical protein